MNGPLTAMAGAFSLGLTFTATTGIIDLSTPLKPPAITVSDVRIWEDGTTFYNRTTIDGKWNAWSGQIFDKNGEQRHCRGGDTSQYFNDENPLSSKDVDWLVATGCKDGLEAGMKFVFTWTPLRPDYATVRFPKSGYGVVQAGTNPDSIIE